MRANSATAIAAMLLLASPLAMSGAYLGVDGTSGEFQYQDVKHSFGGGVRGGYRFDHIPLMLEVGYLTTGDAKIDNFTDPSNGNQLQGSSLNFKGESLTVGYSGRFDHKGSSFFARLGYYSGKSQFKGSFNGTPLDFRENSSGLQFGGGLDWMFNPYIGGRFAIDSLQGVKDIPQLDPGHSSNVTLASFGLTFAFGAPVATQPARTSDAPAPYPVAPPTPQSVPPPETMAAPAPLPLPPPEPVGNNAQLADQRPLPVEGSDLTVEERALRRLAASAPAAPAQPILIPKPTAPKPLAPATPQPVSGPTAKTLRGAQLRSRPTTNAQDSQALAAGSTVRLVTPIKNAEGEWWFITATGIGGGWVLVSELTDFSR